MTRSDKRIARKARIGYAAILAEHEFAKKQVAAAAERLLTPEQIQAALKAKQ